MTDNSDLKQVGTALAVSMVCLAMQGCNQGGRLGSATALATQDVPAGDSANLARGVVFADANNNGVRDDAEPGLSGVRVSNGLDVVLTDEAGRYAIALEPESILFVSQPAGYAVPVDENFTPQFFYRHYPNGSAPVAQWLYPVIEPTGALPASIDFGLIPDAVTASPFFDALVFADPQASTDEFLDMFRVDIINELVGNPRDAQFGVTVGDVVHDDLNLFARHQPIMGTIGIPQWYLPGNHDLNLESPDDEHSLETYKRFFGPAYYSFDYGNVHFIALDNVDYDGAEYVGRIGELQLQWVRNDLASVPTSKLLVVATHIPLLTHATSSAIVNTQDLDDLVDIINGYGFDRVYAMAGHDTSNSWKVDINHEHGFHGEWFTAHTLAQARGAGWSRGERDERGVRDATMEDGNPNGYYLMSFINDRVQPKFIAASGNPVQPARFTFEPAMQSADTTPIGVISDIFGVDLSLDRGHLAAGTKLVINLFDGGERNKVELSFDRGPWQPLLKVLRTDPYVERKSAENQDPFNPPATAIVSSHIWEFNVPDNLTPGVHNVRLRSIDEFDQLIQTGYVFEIMP